MHLIVLVSVVVLISVPAFGQKCELTLEQVPKLRGFRLGMTLTQARTQLTGVSIPKANALGMQDVQLSARALRKNAPTASGDVKRGALSFLDGRLMRVEVVYTDSVGWGHVDEFAFSISQSLGLPPTWPRIKNQEDYDDYRSSIRMLFCAGFNVTAILHRRRASREASLQIENSEYNSLVYRRRQELEERKKARFKP